MRKNIVNIMATTGVSLLVLSVIATCYQARFLCVDAVFQAFFANILIHIGINWLHGIEFQYPIVESILSISYTIIIALVCGKLFHWYNSMPIEVLTLLAIIVYLAGCWLSVIQLRREVKDINALLQRQREHKN